MSTEPASTWWSWSTIVQHADRLGIPDFQRGAVWEQGNRVALLESVFEQSPCGTFVLWAPVEPSGGGAAQPADLHRHGVPLRRFTPGAAPLWLVDGQQRCRAMLGVFDELVGTTPRTDGWSLVRRADLDALRALGHGAQQPEAEAAHEVEHEEHEGGLPVAQQDDGETTEPPVWFVVLPAMSVFEAGDAPLFGALSEARSVRRGSMFRRARPPARLGDAAKASTRPLPAMARGAVPLAALLSESGVFHDPDRRARAAALLAAFNAGEASPTELEALNDALPWGPLFLTGHAFARAAQGARPKDPIGWGDLKERRGEAGFRELAEALQGLFDPKWAPMLQRFVAMWTGERFAVGRLPESDVSAAIDAYVRINRAGVRVRVEERALALLSRARPELTQDLRTYHERRGDPPRDHAPRELLGHTAGRLLGFSVWMATVTRFTALAVQGSAARRWLECAAADKPDFAYRLDRVGMVDKSGKNVQFSWGTYASPAAVVEASVQRATEALLLVSNVLSKELYFDHRMALPSTRPLIPLLELLYFVPTAELKRLSNDDALRAALGRMLQWTLLGPYLNQAQLEELVLRIHGAEADELASKAVEVPCWPERGEALDARLRDKLAVWQRYLTTVWRSDKGDGRAKASDEAGPLAELPAHAALDRLSVERFRVEIAGARSLQHTAVGWLYAIERRGGARELSWAAQAKGDAEAPGKWGVPHRDSWAAEPLRGTHEAELYPEKQHIVPFSHARALFSRTGTRATASDANGIGNLTWLSRRQNTLDALGARWSVFDPELDAENLAARGILAPAAPDALAPTALALYERLRDIALAGAFKDQPEHAKALFAQLCAARRAWMVEQMQAWLAAPLSPATLAWLSAEDRGDGPPEPSAPH